MQAVKVILSPEKRAINPFLGLPKIHTSPVNGSRAEATWRTVKVAFRPAQPVFVVVVWITSSSVVVGFAGEDDDPVS